MTVDFIGYCYSGKTTAVEYIFNALDNVKYWNPFGEFYIQHINGRSSFYTNDNLKIKGFTVSNNLEDFLNKLSKDVVFLREFYHYIFENYKYDLTQYPSNLIIRELNPYLGYLYGFSQEIIFFEEIKLDPYINIKREGWKPEHILKIRKNQKTLTKSITLPVFDKSIDIVKYPNSIKLINSLRKYANNPYYR